MNRCNECPSETVSWAEPASADIRLGAGSSLVGYPSSTVRPITVALSSIEGEYDLVYAYDASDGENPCEEAQHGCIALPERPDGDRAG